jgi:hypothetical protein
MRILLVSPKSSVWSSRTHIHMGLGYLAGALLAAGYDDVTLFDAEVEEEPLALLLARERYDVIGISSPTPLIYEAWEAAAMAKEHPGGSPSNAHAGRVVAAGSSGSRGPG